MNQFINRMDVKYIAASLAEVGTSEQERMDMLANGIKTAQPFICALLRALIGKPCKSIALAMNLRELLSDILLDESQGEKLVTTRRLTRRIAPGHRLMSVQV